jgi:hypothetical protein
MLVAMQRVKGLLSIEPDSDNEQGYMYCTTHPA